MAKETLLSISQDPDERARLRSRRIFRQDREHEQAVARKEGIKEGQEKARAEYEPLLASKDAELANKVAELEALRVKLNALQG